MDEFDKQREREAAAQRAIDIFKILMTAVVCIILFPFLLVIFAASKVDK